MEKASYIRGLFLFLAVMSYRYWMWSSVMMSFVVYGSCTCCAVGECGQ